MTDYVWYPVTGDGQTAATPYVWNGGTINWNTSNFWAQGDALIFGTQPVVAGAIPGSGGGSGAGMSQGPGLDNVGIVAGEISPFLFQFYSPNPSKGDPYIASNNYPVDLLINTGTVDINNLLLGGYNTYADLPQFPTIDVEGATFKVEGTVVNSYTVVFPTTQSAFGSFGGTQAATGGGTVDVGAGGTVQLVGSIEPSISLNFKDGANDLLDLGEVSSAAPTAFSGTVANFASGDTITLPGVPFSQSNTESFANSLLTISNGTTTLAALPMTGNFTTSSFNLVDTGGATSVVTCFAQGTRIHTVQGDLAVEDLLPGDRIPGLLRGEAPIVWIGQRRVDCRRHPDPQRVWPVRVRQGAFADGSPERDLWLSPDHAVFIDGVLIPIKYLIDGHLITQETRDELTYFHVELPDHDVLRAEGLLVESYLDTGNRLAFDNGGGSVSLHPDFAARSWEMTGCAPLVLTGPALDTVRRRLRERWMAIGRMARMTSGALARSAA